MIWPTKPLNLYPTALLWDVLENTYKYLQLTGLREYAAQVLVLEGTFQGFPYWVRTVLAELPDNLWIYKIF